MVYANLQQLGKDVPYRPVSFHQIKLGFLEVVQVLRPAFYHLLATKSFECWRNGPHRGLLNVGHGDVHPWRIVRRGTVEAKASRLWHSQSPQRGQQSWPKQHIAELDVGDRREGGRK